MRFPPVRRPLLARRQDHDDAGPMFDAWSAKNAATPADRDPRSRRRLVAVTVATITVLGAALAAVIVPGASAGADPSAHTWYRLRMCESSDNYATNTGNAHYGAYQFDLATWQSVGGHGYPNNASPGEQDARALILYRERGWQPWQCAGILGLREDGDAASGYIGDIHVPGSGGFRSPSRDGVPAFPGGSHQYFFGENDSAIARFQNAMHARGYFPAGTGQYGPQTLRMVEQLQRLNGLAPLGYIGPKTWRLAWKGRYVAPARATHRPTPTRARPSVPAFPGGTHQYYVGEHTRAIRRFQNEMHTRGYFPAGTGQYGPQTLRMVERLQRSNGLPPRGYIGPRTWRLAWVGRY